MGLDVVSGPEGRRGEVSKEHVKASSIPTVMPRMMSKSDLVERPEFSGPEVLCDHFVLRSRILEKKSSYSIEPN